MKPEEAIKCLKDGNVIFANVREMAIEALEKQIPKKPLIFSKEICELTVDGDKRYDITYGCPCCERVLDYWICKCGQKIDWED